MGKPVPSISQNILSELETFTKFRRALRRSDQLALDDLYNAAEKHLVAAHVSNALPFEVMLLSMLLEQHKEVARLRSKLKNLPHPNTWDDSQ